MWRDQSDGTIYCFCKFMNILKIKLADPLRKRLLSIGNMQQLVNESGISEPTLRKMLRGQWEYIHRSYIELLMDYLGLTASEVFESVPATFWDTIKESRSCVLICGSPRKETGIPLPTTFALKAAQEIESFSQRTKELSRIEYRFENELSEEKLLHTVKTENCIVIGSSKSNPATEILISQIFDAQPRTPTEKNRELIPFGFLWGEDTERTKESSLACSAKERTRLREKPGITWSQGKINVDFREADAYQNWETQDAKDAAVVLVADHPLQTEKAVKLVILAGVGGIGTLAAAHALVRDFRALQPASPLAPVYGIIEAQFSKQRGSMDRVYKKNFRWLYRKGGYMPIDETPKGSKNKPQRKAKAVAID